MPNPSANNVTLVGRAALLTAALTGVFLMAFFVGAPLDVFGARRAVAEDERPKNPEMRVLIGNAEDVNKFTVNSRYVIEDEDGNVLMELKKFKWVRISYNGRKYIAKRGKKKVTSTKPLRVTPVKLHKKVRVLTYENRPAWNPELNDNIFFGSVEVVYSENSDQTLLVNQIPIERYVRGIAEATNNQDPAYQKALLTAARTYALYHITHPTKHADEPYILDPTEGDQVYRGAGFSKRAPNIVAAQRATKRQVITFNDEPIIAPYFSQSDGRTRAWSEVWKGSYDWSTSVDDPCCGNKELLGHGVGMSGEGARYFAAQGWGWKKILNYYYNGVKIEDGY